MNLVKEKNYKVITVNGDFVLSNVSSPYEGEIVGNLINSDTEITIFKRHIVACFVFKVKAKERSSIDLSK